MRTDLDHLPQAKQRELALVVRILFEEFAEITARTTDPKKKAARILKLVLFGSYARGDWVDDPIGGYHSDYDILVVVNDERLTDVTEYWAAADDRLMREVTIAQTLSAPVNFIVHTLTDVNKQLERGRPFFIDILKQGIALYEAEAHPFATPQNLPPEVAKAEAQEHFDNWFASAERRLVAFEMEMLQTRADVEWCKDAAFTLHQATERFYHCVLLVLNLYSPKSHRLNFLRSRAEDIAPALIEAWPRDDKDSRRRFELLRQAYVNARYSPHYKITGEELAWLGERVAVLRDLVRRVCEERLAPRD
ncbi:HEPN domain-containing protein [Sphingomonas sp. HF-S4]|uniref:HEPN domain-containing protein n=1 Tax=Sphingomonas agrestis TaxID=3080540 RepID=A0ABU3YCV3_9SPHN|nr:nucleotidyltransferase domain-containing protein [Sphingomonas sp. HF-S4]MDV3459220.1 HEPN domain-containing protein [Sphingomonas sp. HF-S4]